MLENYILRQLECLQSVYKVLFFLYFTHISFLAQIQCWRIGDAVIGCIFHTMSASTYSHIMERRSPKSPLPRSPFPKSPMPQSPEFYEKYKSKCAYGLINIFHFRQRHSKKLISDKAVLKRHAVGKNSLIYVVL